MSSDFASEFPTLARLELSDEQRQALRQGGFVALERRGPDKLVVKLRFRWQGRQQVRYLGTSPEAGEQARRELARLQEEQQFARDLRRRARVARRALRAAKAASAPLLDQLGLAFHGFEIRRPQRGPRSVPTVPNETVMDTHFHSPADSKENDRNER